MTIRKITLMALVLAVSGLAASWAVAGPEGGDDKSDKPKTKVVLPDCPVMGETVDFSVKTMTKDGPVYFCCKKCIKKFEDKPAKYAKELAAQRKVLAKLPRVQVTCPVSGETVDTKIFAKDGDRKVFFCCKDCIAKYKKDPGKYKAKLADSYTYQAKCPVKDEEIDPEAFITLATGQKVFFCCKRCDKKFLKDPAKYVAKLEAQGTNIDLDKIKAGGKKDSDKG